VLAPPVRHFPNGLLNVLQTFCEQNLLDFYIANNHPEHMKKNLNNQHQNGKTQRINTIKKGIYVLPSFLTSLSMLAGFYSIVATLNGDFVNAAWAILVAGIFDGLDGRVARITHSTTRFGVEYDSLSDLVSFGIAPGVMMYWWALKPLGRLGWLAGFLYVACGAIRLARFNVQINTVESKYFQGLPIPAAAGLVATVIIFLTNFEIEPRSVQIPLLLISYLLAALMVSTVKYNSFKDLQLARRKPFNALIIVVLLIVFVVSEPRIMLFSLCFAYVLSGPTTLIVHLLRKSKTQEVSGSDALPSNVETKHVWQKNKH
jgi:CDP-diacylglycerol--serine O-phosphatidyltransferase